MNTDCETLHTWDNVLVFAERILDTGHEFLEPKSACEAFDEAESKELGFLVVQWCRRLIKERLQPVTREFGECLSRFKGSIGLKKTLTLANDCISRFRPLCEVLDRNKDDQSKINTVWLQTSMAAEFIPLHSRRRAEFVSSVYDYLREDFSMIQAERSHEDQQQGQTNSTVLLEYPFNSFASQIRSLGWFSCVEEPLNDFLCSEIEKQISTVCKGKLEDPNLLKQVCSWLEGVAITWLRRVCSECCSETASEEAAKEWHVRLEFHIFEKLCELRMQEVFDIMTDFPESSPAILDLKECLSRTHQHREFVQALRYALSARLLHPGANTTQILEVYISTIRALRLLDHSGVLLDAASEPVKAYLRSREDTVRCIVAGLTGDAASELFEELEDEDEIKPIAQGFDEEDYGIECDWRKGDKSEEECAILLERLENWSPDPIEADPDKENHTRKRNDILSMLVHIYGSKELFVNEFRSLLATKLLNSLDFDTEKEVRNLELLKVRFGEKSVLNCEVMIKDIEESRRVNLNIAKSLVAQNSQRKARRGVAFPIEAMEVAILSKQFWPQLHGEEICLRDEVKSRMDVIAHEYSVLKNPRELVWKTSLGMVSLELEFDDGQTKTLNVSPLLATILMHVSEREDAELTQTDLANILKLDVETLKSRIAFWINRGIIQVFKNWAGETTYRAADRLTDDYIVDGVVDEDATHTIDAGAQLEAEMRVFEDFVRGMLNNYESLPLDRIHNMLKMFVSTGEHKYDKSIDDLGAFLERLVASEVLSRNSEGHYCMPKRK